MALRGGGVAMSERLKLAVWKFSSCDGCQLTLLDLDEKLVALLGDIEIAYFPEASRHYDPGPYDISLVEGSVSTPHEAELILKVRQESKLLITIGACATAGGIQALRNFGSVDAFAAAVYPSPEFLNTLPECRPASHYVKVDHELHGCPISPVQLLEAIEALLAGRRPQLPQHSVCTECKRKHQACVLVEHGTPCLGPVTLAGCNALCPGVKRGCYGCFGPMPGANYASHAEVLGRLGVDGERWERLLSTFNVQAFRDEEEKSR